MGWLNQALGALGGAATGFVTSGGNPLGAVAGGIGALAGGNQDARTMTQTRQQTARAYTPQEQAVIDQIQGAMPGMLEGMGPEAQRELLGRLHSAAYDPAAQAINQTFDTLGARQDADAMRRGVAGSTTSRAGQTARLGERARALGGASNQATLIAEQGLGQRMASQRAGLAGHQDVLSRMEALRLGGAGSTTSLTGPNTTMTDALGGLGAQFGDKESWINTTGRDWLGKGASAVGSFLGFGGKKPTPSSSTTPAPNFTTGGRSGTPRARGLSPSPLNGLWAPYTSVSLG